MIKIIKWPLGFSYGLVILALSACSGGTGTDSSSSGGMQKPTAEQRFAQQCAQCHQDKLKLTAKITTIDGLTAKIDSDMPFLSPKECVGDCARDLAEYLASLNPDFGKAAVPNEMLIPEALPSKRITREQYKYTIKDILSVELDAELEQLPPDARVDGFTTVASSDILNEHAEAYSNLAKATVAKINWANINSEYLNGAGLESSLSNGQFLDQMGLALFRRPISNREKTGFSSLQNIIEEENKSSEESAQLLIQAMLQAPQFLYRLENNDGSNSETKKIQGYELASRLSYLFWSSAPDAPLLKMAADGELNSQVGLDKAINYLLNNEEKSRRTTRRFIIDMMGVENLAQRDGLTPEIQEQIRESLVATYQALIWDDDIPLKELFTTEVAYLTPTLAKEWYSLTPSGEGIQRYDVSSSPGRVGILTHPAAQAGMNDTDIVGMVARGLYMEDSIFCFDRTPQPSEAILELIEENLHHLPKEATPRDYAIDRLEKAACSFCHGLFEPLAYGFEKLDAIGKYVTENEYNKAFREDGWIPGRDGNLRQDYQNLDEYMQLVAEHPSAQSCLVKKHLQFALGRITTKGEQDVIDSTLQAFIDNGGTYQSMIKAVAKSHWFNHLVQK